MRVVAPYVALHPLARDALYRYAPGAELVELDRSPQAYYRFLSACWAEGESFVNVEQDVAIHELVIPQFEACPEPWCYFPVTGPGPATGGPYLVRALGCVRFSAELTAAEPDLLLSMPAHDWRILDAHALPRLMQRHYRAHEHVPPVLQHHVYGGHCCCRTQHQAYPVDHEGRYCP